MKKLPYQLLFLAVVLPTLASCFDDESDDTQSICSAEKPIVDPGIVLVVSENAAVSTFIGTLTAQGLGSTSEPIEWRIQGGDPDNVFSVDKPSGDLSVFDNSKLDYESIQTYSILVDVAVGSCVSAIEAIVVNVTNVYDAPTVDAQQFFDVSEAAGISVVVGTATATATPIDMSTPVILSQWQIVSGNQAGVFGIDPVSGVISVADNTALDYEMTRSYWLELTVSDGTLTSKPQGVSINVINVNDVTPVIDAGLEFDVSEGATVDTIVGTVTAIDRDTPISFINFSFVVGSVLPNPDNTFLFGVYTGDDSSTYNKWTLETGDMGGRITIAFNTNDPPLFSNWSITNGNTDNVFGIDSQTGVISIVDPTFLDAATTPSYRLGITVSDGFFVSNTENIEITADPVPVGMAGFEIDRLAGLGVEHVIHISVDGLHSSAVTTLGPDNLPGFYRLRQNGAFTDNSRPDGDLTYTLPNHMSQLTSRTALGAGGHKWWFPVDLFEYGTSMHDLNGSYVTGVFDVVHDFGLSTAFYTSKEKFILFRDAWDDDSGAADAILPDSGRNKIDSYRFESNTVLLVDEMISDLAANQYHYTFLHLKDPDSAGHDFNWSLEPNSEYLDAVEAVDANLVKILDFIDSDVNFMNSTVLILTADHGGEFGTDGHELSRLDGKLDSGIIPFYVYGKFVAAAEDIYNWNPATTVNPGITHPFNDDSLQPLRNGDTANFALELLGLPNVPDSNIDNLDFPYF